ncbi:MAG: DUF1957 domain-containing protein [Planctomycetota bacterium]|nr:DUF1957 domain-containing protein [Planctomycetota bacterium]MDI6787656.1 DUF1957 domain-containing protein [Planctomycetota bacterium]
MLNGYLSIILHAHLPYIRHPHFPDFMEEDWLFEAITETYLPLIDAFERLHKEDIPFRLTISLSPTLCEMFSDEFLKNRYSNHLKQLIELSEKELVNTRRDGLFYETAGMYYERFRRFNALYYRYQGNLVKAFAHFQELGLIEIITCATTHGFLPLMLNKESVRAQVMVAVKNYQKYFTKKPSGFWLPECGYYPGIEEILAEAGIKYFIIDTHGLTNGRPAPIMDNYLPVSCGKSKVAAFARDPETSRQVWSAEEGYPGDADYREFYRDLGYDAPYHYIRPYLHSDGVRRNVGIKYYRITGDVPLHLKQPYKRDSALSKVKSHAAHFVFDRQKQIEHLPGPPKADPSMEDKFPIIIAPYDAELFGHWWFEGPEFLQAVIRRINHVQGLKLITPSDYLKKHHRLQVSLPSFSTWGDRGYCEVWLNGKNDWFYRHLHKAEARMIELACKYYNGKKIPLNPPVRGEIGGFHQLSLREKALNQMARELLLAQSSDWAFLLTTSHSECYAHNRFKTHIDRFNRLYEQIKQGRIDPEGWLNHIQSEDNLFEEVDYRVYATRSHRLFIQRNEGHRLRHR